MKIYRVVVVVCLFPFSQAGLTQTGSGSLTGTIFGPDGSTVADIPVQAESTDTDTIARTFSSSDGRYMLEDLPVGSYELSVFPQCCFDAYSSDGIIIGLNETREFDVRLELGNTLNVLADDPGTLAVEVRDRQVIPDLPVPRTSDGNPDFSGVWLLNGELYPEKPSALPWATELFEERTANQGRDHPHTRCLPSSPPILGATPPFMGKFVHTPELLVFLFEDAPGFRQIFLDGRDHPENPNPSWMGHSVGRWEGDTLVVDSVGFNSRGWTNTYPRTEMLRLTERYRRTDYGHLEVRITIDDPGVFAAPWIWNLTWDLAPQEELIEYVCESNKWAPE